MYAIPVRTAAVGDRLQSLSSSSPSSSSSSSSVCLRRSSFFAVPAAAAADERGSAAASQGVDVMCACASELALRFVPLYYLPCFSFFPGW